MRCICVINNVYQRGTKNIGWAGNQILYLNKNISTNIIFLVKHCEEQLFQKEPVIHGILVQIPVSHTYYSYASCMQLFMNFVICHTGSTQYINQAHIQPFLNCFILTSLCDFCMREENDIDFKWFDFKLLLKYYSYYLINTVFRQSHSIKN